MSSRLIQNDTTIIKIDNTETNSNTKWWSKKYDTFLYSDMNANKGEIPNGVIILRIDPILWENPFTCPNNSFLTHVEKNM